MSALSVKETTLNGPDSVAGLKNRKGLENSEDKKMSQTRRKQRLFMPGPLTPIMIYSSLTNVVYR